MWEPASSSSVPVPTPNVELSHFWHSWVGSTLQHPSYWEENLRSGLTVGAVAELQVSLKLPSLVVLGGTWLPFSQVGGIPTSEREPHWWCPKQHDKEAVVSNQVVYIISWKGLCTHNKWPYLEFQFTATNFMSMAAKLSDLADKMPGANLQADGQMEVPTQHVKNLWGSEEEDNSTFHVPSWSPAQRPPSGHPNARYCLEIRVTLTEELGAIPPPSHSWMAPLVEDILWEARTGLTKSVVIGPSRAILFYGRHSMGEGLKVDEARDATFLLTGAGMWVGKAAITHCQPNDNSRGQKGHCSSCIW